MTPNTTLTPTDRILQHLTLHDECSRGDLLSATGLKSYPELEQFLLSLIQEGKITAHWHELGFRTFRLAEVKSHFPRWMLPPKPE